MPDILSPPRAVDSDAPVERMAAPPGLIVGLIAFLTAIDLFATQAILPELAKLYGVGPAAMGTAVNASTFGMVVSSLAVAVLSPRLPRRAAIVACLVALSVPTALLASAPGIATFAALRVVQGVCMAAAFGLTLAYLAEETTGLATTSAFAAYICGNVASNLLGRLMSAWIAGTSGVAVNFYAFAALNLAGAALVAATLTGMSRKRRLAADRAMPSRMAMDRWINYVARRDLAAAFAIGFCILFAFIGIFTYVNFVLVRPPIALGMSTLGLVYLVFLPSIATTPLAARLAAALGSRRALHLALAIALCGMPLMLAAGLPAILAGLALAAIGMFLAQAITSSYIGRAMVAEPGIASGFYLACYFLGGLVGSAVLGAAFVMHGWPACIAGAAGSLALAMGLTRGLRD